MSEWVINTERIKNVVNEQRAISGKYQGISERIETTENLLELSQQKNIINKLEILKEQTKKEANNITSLADKLVEIVDNFEKAEKNIIGKQKNTEEMLQKQTKAYDRTTKTFDDDKSNGTYGADQGDMSHNKKGIGFFGFRWFEDEDLYAYIRSHDRYKNYSQTEIAKLMDQINKEGCGYVAIVNNIFTEYEGREQEFERIFGFPMYDKNGKANYNYLLVDFYASTDDKYYLNDPKGATALVNDVILKYEGKEEEFRRRYGCDPLIDDKYINPQARQRILDTYSNEDIVELKMDGTTQYSIENRFRHYLDEKGVAYECESKENLTTNDVKEYLNKGNNVNIASGSFNLYNANGKVVARDVGDHWMTITGVTDDGRYIVSSWGERYYLNPSELSRQDFFITNVNA